MWVNVVSEELIRIKGLLPIPQATPPSIYLGVPFFFGRPRHKFFNQVLDCIRSKLAGWKMKCLSFAGRLTLVKHVISSVPLHTSLVNPIPSKTCLQIEQLMRNILWSANLDARRCNLVRWETVCLPRYEGGLGLRRVKEFNDACMLRLG